MFDISLLYLYIIIIIIMINDTRCK